MALAVQPFGGLLGPRRNSCALAHCMACLPAWLLACSCRDCPGFWSSREMRQSIEEGAAQLLGLDPQFWSKVRLGSGAGPGAEQWRFRRGRHALGILA